MSTQNKNYLPPSKRKEIINEQGVSQEDLTNENLFPSLCEGEKSTWKGKSFKTTIDKLIASEKLSEQEKILAEEEKRKKKEWTHLSLNITNEFVNRFNTMIEEREKVIKLMNEFWVPMPTQTYKMNNRNNNETDDKLSSVSDEVDSLASIEDNNDDE